MKIECETSVGTADEATDQLLPNRRFLFDSRMSQIVLSCVHCHLWQLLKAKMTKPKNMKDGAAVHLPHLLSACQILIHDHTRLRIEGHLGSVSASLAKGKQT